MFSNNEVYNKYWSFSQSLLYSYHIASIVTASWDGKRELTKGITPSMYPTYSQFSQ